MIDGVTVVDLVTHEDDRGGLTEIARRLTRLGPAQEIRRCVLASSCSVYGQGGRDEHADVLREETAPVAPRAAYSRS
jgi:hypothetical protein